jgi:parallel beta-helix repeat protein
METRFLFRKVCVILSLFILVSIHVITVGGLQQNDSLLNVASDGNTLYVGGSGPGNYSNIMEAIYAAADGDTIFVYSGTYYEHLTISKKLTVQGEDKTTTIVDGNGTGEVVFISTSEVVFSSFTIANGVTGIHLDSGVCNATISDNIVNGHAQYGIDVDGSCDYNLIDGNDFSYNGEYGIYVSSFNEYNTISNNLVTYNKNGTNLQAFSYGLITGNTITDNEEYGLYLMLWCNQNRITRNTFQRNGVDAFFFTSVFNIWLLNYWNRLHLLPKPILGMIFFIPKLNYDLRPALMPY